VPAARHCAVSMIATQHLTPQRGRHGPFRPRFEPLRAHVGRGQVLRVAARHLRDFGRRLHPLASALPRALAIFTKVELELVAGAPLVRSTDWFRPFSSARDSSGSSSSSSATGNFS
jgi:hypothetical protein